MIFVGFRFSIEYHRVIAGDVESWTRPQRADCAIVLTGGSGRVREGFDLLSQRMIDYVIISGVHPHAQLREIFPQWPFYSSVSEKRIVLERHSETTYGNAQQALPIVETLKCRDIVLVTSKLHMYRAYQVFRAIFPKSIAIYKRGVVWARATPSFGESAIESVKSLFYSLWAYDERLVPVP
ncbi:MAG: YdcF family protein [Bdellovibrionales bacterium CG10_big_fil_rev_8_21_14_0_10_45_34]|nr:MAG: YdcF family protein [Bdellovibrionales bacterium CG10_big_fil_rev_8_21_14_0_10_45_34]